MTPWVRRLLIANVLVFFFTQLQPQVGILLALFPAGVLVRPWTPFTHMFVHADIWHLFFNMIALYFFGPRVEARLGSGRFLNARRSRRYLAAGKASLQVQERSYAPRQLDYRAAVENWHQRSFLLPSVVVSTSIMLDLAYQSRSLS